MSSVSSGLAGYAVLVCTVVVTLPALTKSARCDAPLGLENGNITDDQFSASSSLDPTHAAKAARLNVGEGWVAQESNGKEYLQIDLLTQHNVTRYSIQGSRNGWYQAAVLLFYSQDGLVWESYVTSNGTQRLPGTQNSSDVVTIDLNPAVQARYLALVPESNRNSNGYAGLRLELYGCESQQPIPIRNPPVSQDIQGSSEWLPSQSPYVINTLIRIRPGAYVKIHPGVKVIFSSSDAGFIVLGTLEARGVSGLPVVFTASNGFSNLTNMWAGIEVVSQGNLTLESSHIYGAYNGIKGPLGSITIRHCNIHHNVIGINLEMGDTAQDRIQISGTIISDNTFDGIDANNWPPEISYISLEDSDIRHNGGDGIEFETEAVLFAHNCRFSNNFNGIYSYNTPIGATIKKCTFENNQYRGFAISDALCRTQTDITFDETQFKENGREGLYLHIKFAVLDMHISITNSHFINNSWHGVLINGFFSSTRPVILLQNNTMEGSQTTNYNLMYIGTSSSMHGNIVMTKNAFQTRKGIRIHGTNFVAFNISNNIFSGIKGDTVILIEAEGTVMSGNTFTNCATAFVIYTKKRVQVHNNVFQNPQALYDLFVDVDYSENQTLNASHNFWGNRDKFYVRSRICDFFCDVTKMRVEVDPYFASEMLSELSSQINSDIFALNSENVIGGMLDHSVTLQPNQVLYVNRSVYIPEGTELLISKNNTLVFPYKQGILVRGILTIQGEADAKVELRSDGSSTYQGWGGIIFNATGSSLQHTILRHADTGIRLSTNISGEIRASDSIISQCTTSIAGQLWSEVSLSLERVKVNETSRFIVLDVLSSHPVSLNINESEIECSSGARIQTGLNEIVSFHVRVTSTKLYSESTGFYMRSCNSHITISAQDSVFKSTYTSGSFDIVGGVLNITFRGVSVIGEWGVNNFRTCIERRQMFAAGHIDIQDSIFDVQSAVELNFGTQINSQSARHDVLLANNTFRIQGQYYKGIKALITGNNPSWSMSIRDNMFENCGFKLEGSFSNASVDRNTFMSEKSTIDINVQTPKGGSTRITNNLVHGCIVKVKSEEDRERFYLTSNIFNSSTVILMSPNVTLNENTFLAGHEYGIRFEGSGYAGKEINSTYNYWGTTDARDIASRVYDSSYDTSLPTITYVPFYGFPNLTDPRSPRIGFISADGTLGGNVGGTVTLTPEKSPYTVAEDIVVGKLETLTIEAGVTLLFVKGSGIFVEGALIVRGNESHPVRAEPVTPGEKWAGVRLLANRYRPFPIPDPRARLVGGANNNEGRLEVKINGTWGTVCYDGFDENDAKVACQTVGYEYDYRVTEVFSSSHDFGGGSGPVHLGNLRCTGNEETLMECERSVFSCNHGEDVAIRCDEKPLPSPQDVGNDVQLRHFQMNDTDTGLEINGNVTLMENVKSSYSGGHGVTFKLGMKGIPPVIHIDGLESVNNHLSGVRVDMDTDDFISQSQIRISNCDVHSNAGYGVYIQQYVNISLTSCHFSGNSYQTVFSESEAIINIEDSIFSNGNNGVLNMDIKRSAKSHLQVSVINSQFYDRYLQNNNRWSSNIHLFHFPSSRFKDMDIALINNTFHRINANIVYCYTSDQSSPSIYIKDNTFQNITGAIVWVQQPSYRKFQFQFVNNVVENASMPSSEPLMKILDQQNTGGHLNIANNTFSANKASHIILLGDIRSSETDMTITGNIFKDNICSETVNTSSYHLTLRDNIFSNPSAKCELVAPAFARWYDIDARWNFWGTRDMDDVTRRICGFDIDMAKLFVHYLPYYLSEDLTDASMPVQTTFKGGEVTGEVRLQTSESPYSITRSIFIRSDGRLRIDRGVELQFAPNTGIYVDGVLVAGEGGNGERVLLTKATTSWFGVVLPYKTEGVSRTVRLADGKKPNEGRLEIFVNGSWSAICSINRMEALLLCKELGYGSEDFDEYLLHDNNGTVLQDLNCEELASSVSDCQPKLSSNRQCGKHGVLGIRCFKFVAHTGTHTLSYLERVSIQDSKTGLVVESPTVRLSKVHINNTEKVGLTIQTDTIDIDLNGTVVEHGQSTGIMTKVTNRFHLRNGTTQHNQGSGIVLFGTSAPTTVEKMNIINNTLHGLEIQVTKQINKGLLHIRNNRFVDHGRGGSGLQLHYGSVSNTKVYVEQNSFSNNVNSMDVRVGRDNYYFTENRCVINGNIFRSTGQIAVYSGNVESVYIEDNSFKNSFGGDKCFLNVEVDDTRDGGKVKNISLSTNSFQNITGRCVVYIKSTKYEFNGTLTYNQIYSSPTVEGTVLLDSKNVSLSYNMFDNPRADYELKILLAGEEQINAEHNWWGSADPTIAGQRILHKDVDQRLLKVDYLPVLTDPNFDCSEVQNCSDKGECVRPNECRCDEGWAGEDCSDFVCSEVDNCNGNGLCTGPNQCNCSSGWEGASCIIATCHGVNDCGGSERGYCVLPERCACFPQYSGADCSQCAPLRWGDSCLPCPQCNHGSCNLTNGNCDCVAENWSGDLCDMCSKTFYGPNCLPYTNVLNVIPSSGPDTGGTDVHIWGHNFQETDNDIFYCRFDSTVINGTRMSKEHVMCRNPQHQAGRIIVEISPDGLQFTRNQTAFDYYEVCPSGACGKTETPPRGHCFFGGCICTLPWSGQDCSVELKAPVISVFESMQVAAEGDEYHLQLRLIQGSAPVDWYIYGAPSGMTIDQKTGFIFWERTVASVQPYVIKVRASNRIGRTEVPWSLKVQLSYNITVEDVTPSGVLPVPKTIQIRGIVNYFSETSQSLIAFVDLKVRNKGRITTMSIVTSRRNRGRFEGVYFPKSGDSGLFEVDGRHPSDSGFTPQKSWSVLGMTCVPGYVNRQAHLDTNVVDMFGVSVLKNDGVNRINNITARVEGIGGPLTSVVVRTGNRISSNGSQPLIAFLDTDSEVSINLILRVSHPLRPLRGVIAVVFSTPDGTTARVRIGLQLNVRKPALVLSPSSLSESVPRGTQKTFQINIRNEGEVTAKALRVSLPSEPRLTMSAYSTTTTTASEDGLDLHPNETAILVLTVTTGTNDSLGQFSGSVALNSELSSASISYRFYVTSQEKLNITVRVEDEYTYFASDKPLVSGAVVTLRNPRRRYTEQRMSNNQTEFVVFEDVHEDRYTLTATAPGHGSYSAVIIAKPSDSSITIFLQRVAVKYTWTVTSTTFQDKYIVSLDSTFETQVPMPVVTVEPASLNLIPFEEGKKDVINFNITNHGLIRADNVRFALPSHPTLIFTQTIDPIGDVAANTSIIVPILVKLKPRVKKNIDILTCALEMLYDYYCGGTRTGGQDITLTRTYPGRPPLPCGGGSGGGGGGGKDGSGGGGLRVAGVYVGISGTGDGGSSPSSSVVVYNPVTPLNCNCAGAIVKCLKEFLPSGGCLGTMYKIRGASGFWGYVLSVYETVSACLHCRICPPIDKLLKWKKIVQCIYNITRKCILNRRRRATNGELIQGVVNSNVALRNYMIMLEEVFGGQEMFGVYDNSWASSFNLALADDSAGGSALSPSEITSIVASMNATQAVIVEKFLLRWNKTMTAWEDGTLTSLGPKDNVIAYNVIMSRFQQFKTDTENAKQRGFDSIFDDFGNAVNAYQEKEKKDGSDDGVCAKVRVHIVQDLVLTRDAFTARLEIENGEQSALDNIRVTINIKATYGAGTSANDKFSVGTPTLVGLIGVDGTGRLETDVSGTAEWLIIPYSTAAVKEDTLYDVAGTLSYTVDGSNFSIPLLPDTITVKPNPSLTVNYFHEKYVQGDDPMTPNVTEPVVPFTLAVMVTNGAYGVARQLKITSAQPEIIENEKGLLVSFKIIGAQLDGNPVSPSLSIDFGDIESFETKTARWFLTSSLRGKFYNYTATFENINPLGDPQLSIMDDLGYHELVHLVRLESTNDTKDDFLVNDIIDEDELPDAVFDSSNGLYSIPVTSTNVTDFSLQRTETVGTRTYTYVDLTVMMSRSPFTTYAYTRLLNNVTRDSVTETLLQVTRDDGKDVMVGPNAWQTSHYHDKFYLHIFDQYKNIIGSTGMSYSLVFGPKNVYKPTFTKGIYETFVTFGQLPGPILAVEATDKDVNAQLRYSLDGSSVFAIDELSGELQNIGPVTNMLYELTVTATDDGIPSLSSSAKILVRTGHYGMSSSSSTPTTVSTSTDESSVTGISTGRSSSEVLGETSTVAVPSPTTSSAMPPSTSISTSATGSKATSSAAGTNSTLAIDTTSPTVITASSSTFNDTSTRSGTRNGTVASESSSVPIGTTVSTSRATNNLPRVWTLLVAGLLMCTTYISS